MAKEVWYELRSSTSCYRIGLRNDAINNNIVVILYVPKSSHVTWCIDFSSAFVFIQGICGKQFIPAEEHAAKIAAARDAIGDSDFFLVARTDARATSAKTGLSDAISRANLCMEERMLALWRYPFFYQEKGEISLYQEKGACKFPELKFIIF